MNHSVEGDDIQPHEEEDYTRPFGVPESATDRRRREKAVDCGFMDPRAVEPPDWSTVRPSRWQRFTRWIQKHI